MPKRTRRYLYLLLDDWSFGYSIREIDLSADFDSANPSRRISRKVDGGLLPPAIFRLMTGHMSPGYLVAAFGSKILAMQPVGFDSDGSQVLLPKGLVPIFDVHMRSIRYIAQHEPNPFEPIYIPVGCQLYALAGNSFEVLCLPPVDGSGEGQKALEWSPKLPLSFVTKDVTSYAVHSDGRTILVSTRAGTFYFDTEVTMEVDWSQCPIDYGRCPIDYVQWKLFKPWVLPFSGRGYFDPRLDAWVGLSRDSIGHICSCDVVSGYHDGRELPDVKLCKENLFSKHERHTGTTLVYLGGRSHYCLVQFVSRIDNVGKKLDEQSVPHLSVDEKLEEQYMSGKLEKLAVVQKLKKKQSVPDDSADEKLEDVSHKSADEKLEGQYVSDDYFLRILSFSLKYNDNGDLTIDNSLIRMYDLPESASKAVMKSPVAFWM